MGVIYKKLFNYFLYNKINGKTTNDKSPTIPIILNFLFFY